MASYSRHIRFFLLLLAYITLIIQTTPSTFVKIRPPAWATATAKGTNIHTYTAKTLPTPTQSGNKSSFLIKRLSKRIQNQITIAELGLYRCLFHVYFVSLKGF